MFARQVERLITKNYASLSPRMENIGQNYVIQNFSRMHDAMVDIGLGELMNSSKKPFTVVVCLSIPTSYLYL